MRETLAKAVAALLTLLLAAMAAFFAHQRNAGEPASPPEQPAVVVPGPPTDPDAVARGRAVFQEQSCTRCHAAEGRGNPRSPLNGVGARLPPERLRAWVTGAGDARDVLGRSTLRAKEAFRELPAAELNDLVTYLTSLR